MSFTLVINDEPLSEEHISWFTKRDGNEISLIEVVKYQYDHPDHPGESLVPVVSTVCRRSFKILSPAAAPLILLEASLSTVSQLQAK